MMSVSVPAGIFTSRAWSTIPTIAESSARADAGAVHASSAGQPQQGGGHADRFLECLPRAHHRTPMTLNAYRTMKKRWNGKESLNRSVFRVLYLHEPSIRMQ